MHSPLTALFAVEDAALLVVDVRLEPADFNWLPTETFDIVTVARLTGDGTGDVGAFFRSIKTFTHHWR